MSRDKALFAGCLITSRFPEYELASKIVLRQLNIQTHTLQKAVCCGYVIQGIKKNWIYLAAYNLALAEQNGMDLITLCGGCTNTFKRLQFMCRQDPQILKDINRILSKIGLHFNNTIKVQHLLEVLAEKINRVYELCKNTVPLKIAIMNPCQIFRPSAVMQFDNATHPTVMQDLLVHAVKTIIPYSLQDYCCGASLNIINPAAAYAAGTIRLQELANKDVDAIVTACGNCHLLLHCLQSQYYSGQRIPCLFLPQLLGLAMGFTMEDLMINNLNIRKIVDGI